MYLSVLVKEANSDKDCPLFRSGSGERETITDRYDGLVEGTVSYPACRSSCIWLFAESSAGSSSS